jgi:replicative DNA helicase
MSNTNLDCERSVLGAILLNSSSIDDVSNVLLPAHFSLTSHQLIYKAMTELAVQETPIDLATLSEQLGDKISEIGGVAYLTELIRDCVAGSDVEYHAQIVVKEWQMRELMRCGEHLRALALQGKESPADIITRFQAAIEKIYHTQEVAEFEYLEDIWDRLSPTIKAGGKPVVSKTFYRELDQKILGFECGTLTILAARPSVGKSAFGIQIAIKHLLHDLPVLIFSLEMNKTAIANRIISNLTRIPLQEIRRAQAGEELLDEEQNTCIDYIRTTIIETRLATMDISNINALQIKSYLKKQVRIQRPSLVIVDYLNLMETHTDEKKYNQQIAQIVKSLRQTAKQLDIPILLICQINRGNEETKDKRPQLHNLKESGAIEEHADMVIFIHRPDITAERASEEHKDCSIAEIIIAKQRNGEVGTVKMNYHLDCQRFEPIDAEHRETIHNPNLTD